MTHITQTLYNNGTLSPFHCYQAHSDICLCDQICQWRMRSKRTMRNRQPTEETAELDFLVFVARCLPELLLRCVGWRCSCGGVSWSRTWRGSGSRGVKKRNRENTRFKKEKSFRNEQENKMKTRIAKIRLKWAFFLFAGFSRFWKVVCC